LVVGRGGRWRESEGGREREGEKQREGEKLNSRPKGRFHKP
jgi:hypothetical protein